MHYRHAPEEPQQLGSEKFLTSTSDQQWFYSIIAIPLGTCEKAKAWENAEKEFQTQIDHCIQ